MDDAMLWLWIFGAAMILAMVLISRLQARSYKSYLARHVEETTKVTANQREILEVTRQQAAALERIAAALETKG